MKVRHCLKLSPMDEVHYLTAVKMVLDAGKKRKPFDPLKLHQTMFRGHDFAGKYRNGVVFDSRTGAIKHFPVSRFIPELMYSFRSAYKKALRLNHNMSERQLAFQAWLVGSQIRCLHPFSMGDNKMSYLLTNHIRQVHGLPWTIEMESPHVFKAVRTLYRVWNSEYYSSP